MYDLIGDIHGHAEPLKKLLRKMDYKESGGAWQHSSRKAVFVGDYIDRGPAIRETLHIVRTMQERGSAIALMGNHEYNALAYAYELPEGGFLREHNVVHYKQHEQTLLQFENYGEEWQSYLEWFYSLPLFFEEATIRAVHACWDEAHIEWLKKNDYYQLKVELIIDSHRKGTLPYHIINDILKGKEYNIPERYAWKDKDGHVRTQNRFKWWLNPVTSLMGDFLFNCPPELKELELQLESAPVVYDRNAPPVFFGHYWLEDNYPVVQADNVVCLDYSIAKGGNLVAYRWMGEQKVNNHHFIHVNYSG